jgi:hypothetical protein
MRRGKQTHLDQKCDADAVASRSDRNKKRKSHESDCFGVITIRVLEAKVLATRSILPSKPITFVINLVDGNLQTEPKTYDAVEREPVISLFFNFFFFTFNAFLWFVCDRLFRFNGIKIIHL